MGFFFAMFLRASAVSMWTLCGSPAADTPKEGRSLINIFRLPGWPALPRTLTPMMSFSTVAFFRAWMMILLIGCGWKQNKSFRLLCLKLTFCHGMCDTYCQEISRTRWVLNTIFSHQCTVAQHDHLMKKWDFTDLKVHKKDLQKCQRNCCLSCSLKFPFLKCERQILGLTCLPKVDSLDVSCHHVHRCYQGLSSFSNS